MRKMEDRLKSLAKNANKRAKKRGDTNRITVQDVSNLWNVTIFCSICGRFIREPDASLDHRIPFADGGINRIENIAIVHYWCNNLKDDKDLMDAREKILESYPIEKTGIAFIDSFAMVLLGPLASDRITRSELPDNFGDLSYLDQIRALDPNKMANIENEVMETLRHGTVEFVGIYHGREVFSVTRPGIPSQTEAVREWFLHS